MHIKDYIILVETSFVNLEISVRSAIENGWEPIGGVSYSPEDDIYIQAIIKKEE